MNGYESNTTHNYLWELNLLVKPLQKHLQFHCHSKRFWSNRNLSSEWRNWLTVLWIKPFQLNNKREVELRLSHVAVKIIFLPRHVTTIMLHPKWYVRIQRHLPERKSKGGRPREKSRILTDTQNTKKKQLLKKYITQKMLSGLLNDSYQSKNKNKYHLRNLTLNISHSILVAAMMKHLLIE